MIQTVRAKLNRPWEKRMKTGKSEPPRAVEQERGGHVEKEG